MQLLPWMSREDPQQHSRVLGNIWAPSVPSMWYPGAPFLGWGVGVFISVQSVFSWLLSFLFLVFSRHCFSVWWNMNYETKARCETGCLSTLLLISQGIIHGSPKRKVKSQTCHNKKQWPQRINVSVYYFLAGPCFRLHLQMTLRLFECF